MNPTSYYRYHRIKQTMTKIKLPPSTAFDLSRWELTEADRLDLWANVIEGLAIITRMTHGTLSQTQTLAGATLLSPPLSGAQLHQIPARDLETLVARLRDTADRERTDTMA